MFIWATRNQTTNIHAYEPLFLSRFFFNNISAWAAKKINNKTIKYRHFRNVHNCNRKMGFFLSFFMLPLQTYTHT